MGENTFERESRGPGSGRGRGRDRGDAADATPRPGGLLNLRLYQRILLWCAILALTGLAVMLLWNALMPDITGVPRLNYLQACGLLVLSRLLFGGLAMGRPLSTASDRLHERWGAMSADERREFQRRRRRQCGCDGHGEPPPASGPAIPGARPDSRE